MDERKEKILGFMKEEAYKPLLMKELAVLFDVPKKEIELFKAVLDELESEGKIFKTHKDRYGIPERMNLISGKVQGSERGYAFLIPLDETVKDVFIAANNMNGAMNNDKVIARINKKSLGDKRSEGEIIKIIERANQRIVGTFEDNRNFGFVVSDDKRIPGDIFIAKNDFNGAKNGQKVVVEMIKWPDQRRNAEGKISEIIGDKDAVGIDILSIIKAYNLNEDFPEDVTKQLELIPDKVTEDMLSCRRDLRNLRMVTIDGEDAKDLDDAVSIEKLPGGNFRLGVHIADVTHYVKENSPLDIEALRRGTSVYLVDRVIPMLPRKLSNGICSLNPKIDRLSFTVMMDIDYDGKVVSHDIFESVINIDERMTYTNVYKILEENNEELKERYNYLLEDFQKMKELALILKKKRTIRGAIDFDFEEAKVILDENGVPIEIKRYEITIANKIIEEFMLACNETVAEHFYWQSAPFIYRIHEDPDRDRIDALVEFVHNMGYVMKGVNKIHPKAIQELIQKVKGTKEERIISMVTLRSLQKARYSHQHQEHFGLAAKFYSHFTSPIRRYPDLCIHRIMKEYLIGRMDKEAEEKLNKKLPDITSSCSTSERQAEAAERETVDLKKVEYMKNHIGEEFRGIISNITSFGMFIELDNTIEGLIRLSNMEDDYYIFDDKRYTLIGERTRKTYRIGDEVEVILSRADMITRQIDFNISDKKEGSMQQKDLEKRSEKRPIEETPTIKESKHRSKKFKNEKTPDKNVIKNIKGKTKKRKKKD